MTIDKKIRYEKQQHDVRREAAKTSALSSGKIDKYEYLTEEKILSYGPSQIIQERQAEAIQDQGKTSQSFKIFTIF